MQIELKTLTSIWTGGINGKLDRLHETGLLGSLRWWYETLVRGLDGYACDPTAADRCPDQAGNHCAACELFGCTGWARKFRLLALDTNDQPIQRELGKDEQFRLKFVEMRPIHSDEKWLLTKAVEIAANYGALGGKTTLKPQTGSRGADFGLVQLVGSLEIPKPTDIKAFLKQFRQGNHPPEFPDLRNFFFFKGVYLTRAEMNKFLGLNEKGGPLSSIDDYQKFLQGRRGDAKLDAVSKKIFSFKAADGRIWGYAKNRAMRDKIINLIQEKKGSRPDMKKNGEEALNEL